MKCIDLPTDEDTPENIRLSVDELSKDTRPGTIEMMNTLERYAQTLERVAELEAQIAAHERVCAGVWVPVGERKPPSAWVGSGYIHGGEVLERITCLDGRWVDDATGFVPSKPDYWLDDKLPTSSGEGE